MAEDFTIDRTLDKSVDRSIDKSIDLAGQSSVMRGEGQGSGLQPSHRRAILRALCGL